MKARNFSYQSGKSIVILHGLDGSPDGHWQCWLAGELKRRGHRVVFPELPQKNRPNLIEWIDELHLILSTVGPGSVLVAHSLGALLWLYYASVPQSVKLSNVLLVAPPGGIDLDQGGRVIGRRALSLDRNLIHQSADCILLVGSEDDPYNVWGFISEYALPLGLPFLKLPDEARHVNIESGFGPWPFALEWSLEKVDPLESFPRATYSRPEALVPRLEKNPAIQLESGFPAGLVTHEC